MCFFIKKSRNYFFIKIKIVIISNFLIFFRTKINFLKFNLKKEEKSKLYGKFSILFYLEPQLATVRKKKKLHKNYVKTPWNVHDKALTMRPLISMQTWTLSLVVLVHYLPNDNLQAQGTKGETIENYIFHVISEIALSPSP